MKKLNVFVFMFSLLFASFSLAQADNVRALMMALDDEYKARAVYSRVLDDFGRVRPFSKIIYSEQRHIDALIPFFAKYGVDVPDDSYYGRVPGYDSIQQACEAAIIGEMANVELYNKIFELADDPDLIAVFENLQWVSQNRHLPAFQRCAE